MITFPELVLLNDSSLDMWRYLDLLHGASAPFHWPFPKALVPFCRRFRDEMPPFEHASVLLGREGPDELAPPN
jgi:hypothetical protein